MTHGSLFSGIGGFDLAAEWIGWENKFHCEWNEFGQKVLHYYWPEAELFTDITKSNFTKYANKIDILTGGFPCQPYSSAGKRLGKEDSRHLWPEMLRVIREVQPRWVVGENVRGLTNWNGGMVFDEVQADLEAIGYEVTPFLLPACAVNAPHRRDRIWFVAKNSNEIGRGSKQRKEESKKRGQWDACSRNNELLRTNNEKVGNVADTNSNGLNQCNSKHEINTSEERKYAQRDTQQSNDNGDVTDTLSIRLQQCKDGEEMGGGQKEMARERSEFTNAIKTDGEIRNVTDSDSAGISRQSVNTRASETIRQGRESIKKIGNFRYIGTWSTFPTISPICNGNDGIPSRLDSITFSKWRNESIKAGGNAIVPQVALQIFKAIEEYESLNL